MDMNLNIAVSGQTTNLNVVDTNLLISAPGYTLASDISPSQALSIQVQDQTLGVIYVRGDKGDKGDKGDTGPRGSGISSVNGLTGDVNIYGTGGNLFVVTVAPNRIYISGSGLATSGDIRALSGYLSAVIGTTGSNLYNLITGVSGFAANSAALSGYVTGQLAALSGYVVQQDSALSARIESTGQTLYNLYTGISGGNAIALSGYVTGQVAALSGYVNQQFDILSGQNSVTGSTLYGLITGLSGQAQTDYATKISLYQTGSYLYGLITGVSGTLSASITALSGQVSGQNSALSGLITGTSGILNGSIAATGNAATAHANSIGATLSGNLTASGSTLNNRINSVSGWVDQTFVHRTGYELISGVKQFASSPIVTGIQFLGASGSGIYLNVAQDGTVTFAGGSGSVATIGSGTSGSIFAVTDLFEAPIIDAYSDGKVILGQYLTNTLLVSGSGVSIGAYHTPSGYRLFLSGDTQYIGNIFSGSVGGQVTNIADLFYPRQSNPSGYITGLPGTGNLATVNQLNSLSGFTTGASGYLQNQIAQTGSVLQGRFTTLSGFTTGASGFLNTLIVQTGNASTAYTNSVGTALSGTIGQTGSNLYALITGSSGVLSSQTISSGALLYNLITGASGTNVVYTNSVGTSISGNLYATGSSLYTLSTGLSGYLKDLVLGGSGGVISVNGISGVILLQGTGNVSVTTQGQTLIISGDTGAYINFVSQDQFVTYGLQTDAKFQALSGWSEQFSGVLATSTAQTGQSLFGIITGLSGFAQGNFATQTALYSTGSNLYNLITGLSGANNTALVNASGVLNQKIMASGSGLYNAITGMGYTLSGQLTTTGQTLYGQTTGLSGYLIDLISAASAGVTALNGASGVVNIYGTGAISVFNQGQTIWVSGEIDAGAYATTVFVTGISGFLQNQINLTGANSILYASGASGVLASSVNAMSGWCTLTSGVLASGTAQTGSTLNTRINSLSGWTDQTFVHRTGQELISGRKIFASSPVLTGIEFLGASGSGIYLNVSQDGTVVFAGGSGSVATIGSGTSGSIFAVTDQFEAPVLDIYSDGRVLLGQYLTNTMMVSGSGVSIGAGYIPSGYRLFISGDWQYIGNVFSGNQNIANLFYPRQGNPSGFITGLPGTGTLVSTGQLAAFSGFATGISGALQTIINLTGNAAVAHANGIGASLSGNITQTGVTLNGRINSLSGYVDQQDYATGRAAVLYVSGISGVLTTSIIATGNASVIHANSIGSIISGNLTATGQTLQGRINSLSGFVGQVSGALDSRIIATGNAAVVHANGVGINLSGQLAQTGSILYTLLTGMSGQMTGDYATKAQLTQTGVDLGARISVLSGYVEAQDYATGRAAILYASGLSGALNATILATGNSTIVHSNRIGSGLSGALTQTGVLLGGQITALSGFTTGISGVLQAAIDNLGNASGFITTGQTGQFYPASNPRGYVTSGDLAATGSNLYIILTGLSGQSVLDYATKTQLTQTGVDIGNRLTSLSGYIDQQDYATGRANILYSSGISGTLNATIITTGDAVVAHSNSIGQILSGELTATGKTLQGRINSLSGFVEQVSGGLETRIAQTGQASFLATSGASGVLAGFIAQTGSNLYVLITGMSGQGAADYATKTQLTITGQTLQGRIDSLSGYVGLVSGGIEARIAVTGNAAVTHANGIGVNLSGNLAQTGATLIARDNSISGVLQAAIDSISAGTGIILRDVVYTSGTQFISGTKYFIGNTYIDNLYVTGTQTVVNTQDIYVGNNWMVLNATGGARDSAIFISTGYTGMNATGGVVGFDVPSNTWRFGLGGYLTDLSSLPSIASITDIVNASGSLEARIVQTGSAAVAYANSIGLNLSGVLAQTGVVLISLNLATSGVLTGRLYQTGIDLYNQIYNTGQVILAASGGLEARIAATGNSAVTHANGIGVNLSGALTQTGVILGGRIAALSGFVTGFNGGVVSYLTGLLPTGLDIYYLNLPVVFPTVPRITATIELQEPANGTYGFVISGRSTTGFYLLLSDTIDTSGVFLDVIAKV